MERRPWLEEAFIAALAFLLPLLPALWWPWFVLLGPALYIGWHLHQMQRLLIALRKPGAEVPEGRGIWGEVFERLYRERTKTRERRRKLQRRLERYEESSQALPDAVVALDSHGEIDWLNAAAEALLGLDSRKDVGRRVTNVLRHPDFVGFFNTGDYGQRVDFPDPVTGQRILVAYVVRYGKRRRLLIVRDVTEVRRLAQVRRDFVANASHELRTPLTVILGYLETMTDGDDGFPPRWRRPLQVMLDQGRRMLQIINDMLALARLEEKPALPEMQPVPVAELVASLCEATQRSQPDKPLDITLDLDEATGLLGSAADLRSIFGNLIDNAAQHNPPGTAIRVVWERLEDGGARFEVSDRGRGIAPEHLDRLTERFYRVGQSPAVNGHSTGLGLAIVKHALAGQDGELVISSTLGEGSRFCCLFPASRVTALVPAERQRAQSR